MNTDTDAGAAGAGAGAGAPQGQADAGAPSIYRPEGLPDHLAGASERETIDKLYGAYSGLRRTMGDKPAAADAYSLTWGDDAPDFLKGMDAADPLLAAAREAALARGLTTEQFGVLGDVLSKAAELKLIEAPLDPAAEMATYGGETAYQRDLGTITTLADTLKAGGKIDDAGYAELRATAVTAAGLRALMALRSDPPSAFGKDGAGGSAAPGDTMEAVQAAMRDPRYASDSPTYDPAYRAAVYARLQKVSGGR